MSKGVAVLHSTLRSALAVCAVLPALIAGPSRAASSTDPDWPCIQPKVPQIAAGQVWSGPPVEEIGKSWRKDRAISELAQKLAERRTSLAEAKTLIGNFAASLQGDKSQPLTALFARTLTLINSERASIIAGIGRYAKRQRALSKKIEDEMAELNQLPQDESEDSVSQRQDLLDVQAWDVRIFQEREKALRYVCEQPVLLEQRAFAIGREIQAHLK
ncbi:MAG: hypothetical protein ACKVOI_04165 [Dongiaceae bacterium]